MLSSPATVDARDVTARPRVGLLCSGGDQPSSCLGLLLGTGTVEALL